MSVMTSCDQHRSGVTVLSHTHTSSLLAKPLSLAIEGGQRLQLLTQHPDPEVPQGILDLVTHVLAGADAKHLIKLLERKGLGLGNEEEDEEPKDSTPSCVPPKRTLDSKGPGERWPRKRQNEVEAPGCCSRPRHANISDVDRECFGRIGERHGAFARRVKYLEEIHACGDHADSLLDITWIIRDQEGQASP